MPNPITLPPHHFQAPKKVFFVSDLHLGTPNYTQSRLREQKFVQWLHQNQPHMSALYIVGDLFDFWYEYKTVVPRGYVRTLGTLAQIADAGIPIHFFTGNHDLWMFGYFQQELGIQVHHQPVIQIIQNQKFMIGHGDGLGPGDYGYKVLKKVFTNPICQTLFGTLHPNIALGVANYFSQKSRNANPQKDAIFLGNHKEWLLQYCQKKIKQIPDIKWFIFGHRHLPLHISLSQTQATYINLGDWLQYYTYAVFDGNNTQLLNV